MLCLAQNQCVQFAKSGNEGINKSLWANYMVLETRTPFWMFVLTKDLLLLQEHVNSWRTTQEPLPLSLPRQKDTQKWLHSSKMVILSPNATCHAPYWCIFVWSTVINMFLFSGGIVPKSGWSQPIRHVVFLYYHQTVTLHGLMGQLDEYFQWKLFFTCTLLRYRDSQSKSASGAGKISAAIIPSGMNSESESVAVIVLQDLVWLFEFQIVLKYRRAQGGDFTFSEYVCIRRSIWDLASSLGWKKSESTTELHSLPPPVATEMIIFLTSSPQMHVIHPQVE